jgi:hypothetical protein
MADQTQNDNFAAVVEIVLSALFDEYESLSIQNKAYQSAIAKCDSTTVKTLQARIENEIQTLQQIPKYSDLRGRAIEAVQLRDPVAFAGLIQQVKTRSDIWGGHQKKGEAI